MLPKAYYAICVTAAAVPLEWTWGGVRPVIWARDCWSKFKEKTHQQTNLPLSWVSTVETAASPNALLFFELMPQEPHRPCFQSQTKALLVPFVTDEAHQGVVTHPGSPGP